MRTLRAWALALARVHIHLACPLFLRRGPPATIISTIPEDNNTINTNIHSRPCLGLIIAGNLVPQSLHSDSHIDQLRATITEVLGTVATAITATATATVTVTVLTVVKVVTSTTSKAVLLPRGPLETCKCARCTHKGSSARVLLLQTTWAVFGATNGPVS
jgi:hypothetical protein